MTGIPEYPRSTLMADRIRQVSNNNRGDGTWKIFLILLIGAIFLRVAVSGVRIWIMTNRLDHYIFEYGFVGPAYVVFDVPNADSVNWNEEHNGWDFNIKSDTQVLFTSLPAKDKSIGSINKMIDIDGDLVKLPIQRSDGTFPYFTRLGRSGPITIDIVDNQYVQFWTLSPFIECYPCPVDQEYPRFRSRDSLREWIISELKRRIKSGEIPLSSLKVLEYR